MPSEAITVTDVESSVEVFILSQVRLRGPLQPRLEANAIAEGRGGVELVLLFSGSSPEPSTSNAEDIEEEDETSETELFPTRREGRAVMEEAGGRREF